MVKYIGNKNQAGNRKRSLGMEEFSIGGQGRQRTLVFEDEEEEEEEEKEEEDKM